MTNRKIMIFNAASLAGVGIGAITSAINGEVLYSAIDGRVLLSVRN